MAARRGYIELGLLEKMWDFAKKKLRLKPEHLKKEV